MNSNEKKIILNGQKLTEQEFAQRKQELSSQRGVELVELSSTHYKTRIKG